MAIYQQVNLYQPIFRKQRQVFSARTMAQAIAVVAAALLGMYAFGVWKLSGLDAEVVQLEGREKAFAAQLGRIDPNLGASRRAEVEQEIKSLNATLLDQQRLIDVLRDQPLGTTQGFSSYLAALGRQHTPLLWLTSLTINGATREVPEEMTVRELVEHLGLGGGPVAVEVNREIVPRAEHGKRKVAAGDTVEIVHFVGGG